MEALTGRRRKYGQFTNSSAGNSSSNSSSTSKAVFIPGVPVKEFVPDIYKAVNSKKFRVEQPESEEERLMIKNLPCDTEATLQLLRDMLPKGIFQGRLPPVILYSQLSSIMPNQFLIDSQLSKLAKENRILTFSTFTSSNYLIVFLEDFLKIEREGIFNRFVTEVLAAPDDCDNDNNSSDLKVTIRRSLENSKYFTKESLRKKWKFEEDEIRQLVNGGYLGIQEGGFYCISLPGAGEFIKCYEKGKKAVMNAIKRAKFGEILQNELEQRPMKKAAPLGVLYHIYDLIGSREVVKVETTSGLLLRIKRKT